MTSKQVRQNCGLTLPEILIVFFIVVTLAVLSVPAYQRIREKTKEVVCISRMKRIYHALDSYVKENGHWPQPPEADVSLGESAEWKWWILSFEPYGVSPEQWLCPVEEKSYKSQGARPKYAVSYIPTEFDTRQMTPYRWNQPWLTERGNFHRKGNHMLMPDGSINASPVRASFGGK